MRFIITFVNAAGLKVQACQKRGVHGAPEASRMSGEASLPNCVGSNPITDSTVGPVSLGKHTDFERLSVV